MDSRRILVVDDSALMRELARLALETVAGWEVVAAESGDEALELGAADPPDAILLDVVMPGKDGPATLAELQAAPATREVPVIFVTAKGQPSDLERFTALGVAGVIAKPFEIDALAGQVAAILGWGP
jgi:two-component system alkaline phosphatase synthesis response regulator PhoP